jgi:putative phosphoribosyl transferase
VPPSAFTDRADAGRQLAQHLARLELAAPVVLGLPRGGVPVAVEVAAALGAPVDVLVARKIGAPGRPEFGVGAIAEGGEPLFDADLLRGLRLTPDDLADTVAAERAELARRVRLYRGTRALPELAARTVVLVDDGIATGSTARAALRAIALRRPARTVLAVPVGPPETLTAMADDADEVVAVLTPRRFGAVSRFYDAFPQLSDGEVTAALRGT